MLENEIKKDVKPISDIIKIYFFAWLIDNFSVITTGCDQVILCKINIFMKGFESSEGININGKLINNLRYADHTVLIANGIGNPTTLVNRVKKVIIRYGLSKTLPPLNIRLRVGNSSIERVIQYKYSGIWLNVNNNNT